jgi:hypothetical protein
MLESGDRASRRGLKAFVAIAVTFAAFTTLAFFGGLGSIASVGSSSAAEYEYGGKVTICHRTGSPKNPLVTLSVNASALDTYLARGDTLGPCP